MIENSLPEDVEILIGGLKVYDEIKKRNNYIYFTNRRVIVSEKINVFDLLPLFGGFVVGNIVGSVAGAIIQDIASNPKKLNENIQVLEKIEKQKSFELKLQFVSKIEKDTKWPIHDFIKIINRGGKTVYDITFFKNQCDQIEKALNAYIPTKFEKLE